MKHSLRSKENRRYLNPKYNDLQYHKTLLDEVMKWELIDFQIKECEDAGAMSPKGKLSSLIILKNKINEVR